MVGTYFAGFDSVPVSGWINTGPPEYDYQTMLNYWRTTAENQLGWMLKGTNLLQDEDFLNAFGMSLNLNDQGAASARSYVELKIAKAQSGGGGGAGYAGPSTAQQAAQIEALMKNVAGMFGLPDQDWSGLAMTAASNHWSADMVRDELAKGLTLEMANREGIVKTTITKARELASNYFINVSDQDGLDWAKRIASDEMDDQGMATAIRDRAKSQYGWLSNVIDSGVTLKDYFRPHRETAAKLLEVAPDQIDFTNDPRWQKVMRAPSDNPNDPARSMTLNEVASYVRNMDEWKNTANAKSTASSAVTALGKIMGSL